jgi:hypothetical protein
MLEAGFALSPNSLASRGFVIRRLPVLLFWFVLTGLPAIAGEIPEALHIPGTPGTATPYPAWVAAGKVLTPSGEVNPTLFSPGDRSIISGYLRQPAR